MQCPACSGDLVSVNTQNHYGTRLVVETCTACGGFWLEAIEPVGIGFEAVKALDGDAPLEDIATEPRDDFRACPQCNTALREITGGTVPEGLHIDRCDTCHGMWFDRGELLVYKSALEAKRNTMRKEEFAEAQKRYRNHRLAAAQAYRRRAGFTSLGLLGALDGLTDIT